MKALYIVLPILLFIALLLFSRVRFSFSYSGEIRLHISYLFVRIPLYPRKKSKPKAPKRKKAPVPMKDKHKAATPQTPAKKEGKKAKSPLKLGDIRFLLRLCREVVAHILDRASRHVRITVKRLALSIGGADDAARAAIEYGLVSQSVAYLLEFLRNTGFLKPPKRGAINVGVDFLEKENALHIRTDIACRLVFLIPFALSSLTKALSAKNRWKRHRARTAGKPQNKYQETKENDNG